MLHNISFLNTIFNDAPHAWQIGFQDSAAPGFTGIVELHNTIFFLYLAVFVLSFLLIYLSKKGLLGLSLKNFAKYNNLTEGFFVFLTVFSFLMLIISLSYNLLLFI